MIAFTIGGRPIYRYGIFYLITFVSGYFVLWRLGKREFFRSYPGVHRLLTTGLDNFVLIILIGVMLGGRLGHVFLYERSYYREHMSEILAIREGGMSFVGGVIGVTIGLIILQRRQRLRRKEFLLLGDIILCIVPIGILLGRIGNYLNQELRGKPLSEFSPLWQHLFSRLGVTHIYENVDHIERVNTNIIQSIGEGGISLILGRSILWGRYIHQRIQPGLISGLFLCWYGVIRFLVEYLKDLPAGEVRGLFSVSQWVMILFFIIGSGLIRRTLKG